MPAKKAAAGTPSARAQPPQSARQEVRQLRGELEDLLAAAEADDAAPAPVAQRRLILEPSRGAAAARESWYQHTGAGCCGCGHL